MKPQTIRPGHITSIWIILYYLKKYNNLAIDELTAMLRSTGLRGGSLPLQDGYETCLALKLIARDLQQVSLTKRGEYIASRWKNIEPNSEVKRLILYDVVNYYRPLWLIYLELPFETAIIYIKDNWQELIRYSNLVDRSEQNIDDWWLSLRTILKARDEEVRKEIGSLGEEKTIEYEKKRLMEDGYPNLASKVMWVSKISDAFGYDVKSAQGNYNSGRFTDDIFVEVKTTASYSKTFIFFLTRHEYETALNNSNYLLYLWNGVLTPSKNLKPKILRLHDIANSIPFDSPDGSGKWTECRIAYQFSD